MFETNDKDDPAKQNQIVFSRASSKDAMDSYNFGDSTPIDTQVVRNGRDLDSPGNERLFNNLIGHFRRELERQGQNRAEQGLDEDFYDGDQWKEEDKAVLEGRGQMALVYNVISNAVNWMLGTEKRGRVDYKILPRLEEGSKPAEKKSQLLKYLSDVNKSDFHVSRSFKDTTVVGVGWIESGVQDDDEGEAIYDRYESWRNILGDTMATEMDLSDGRYIFRAKWVDEDIAKAMFPDRAHVVERAVSTSFDLMRSLDGAGDEQMDAAEEEWSQTSIYGGVDGHVSERGRVRLIEAWFRIPVQERFIRGGQFTGEVFDARSPGHAAEVKSGNAKLVDKVRMRMHCAIMCEDGLLFLAKSPYRHNQFPFTPIWCYRKGRNNLPYGVVRAMRGPQEDINKRASKALHILSSNKVIMDEGAVADMEKFEEENARPDGILVKRQGKQLVLDVDRDLAPAHLDLMSRSISMIQQLSGITDENMGRTTNATSGKAIIARQDQGALATASIFDNLRLARQIHGSKMLSLMEQFMSERKQFRITNMRGNPEFITVNDDLPENDIVRTKADFIISEEDWSATMRQAQVEALFELMGQLGQVSPEIVMASLDLIVETMDVPQREELVKRIRAINGQADPDADPNNPDPETQAREEQKKKESDYMEAMALAELETKQAEAKEKTAKAEKAGAEAGKIVADIRRILADTAGANVETQVKALEAAATIMRSTAITGMADTVLEEAGYEGAPGLPAPPPRPPGQVPPGQMPPGQMPPPQPQPTPPPMQGGF